MEPFDGIVVAAPKAAPRPRAWARCASVGLALVLGSAVLAIGYRHYRAKAVANANVSPPKVPPDTMADIPAFVLNLDRRPDRLQNMSKMLQSQAPWLFRKTCRVPAPDGRAFGDHLKASLIPETIWRAAMARTRNHLPTVGGPLTQGAVALVMGHARMWEHLVRTQAPWGILMEDDLRSIHPDLEALLSQLGDSLPAPGTDWDYLQMQGGDCFCANGACPKLYIKPGTSWNTGMYIITLEAAKRAIKAHFPMTNDQLDNPYNFLRSQCRGHSICPIVAFQWGSLTDSDVQIPPKAVVFAEEPSIPDCPPLEQGQMLLPDLMDPEATADLRF